MRKERYYSSFDEDFHQNGIEYKLPDDYKWIDGSLKFRICSEIIYGVALVISGIACRLAYGVKFYGREKLKETKGGCFIYANHTCAVGDVFHPALACMPRRIYTLINPINFSLSFIGKLLKPLGALPVANTLSGMKSLESAIFERFSQGHAIVVYPEAHLWDYYTDIRPFSDVSFRYPAKLSAPVYSMTTVYRKRRLFKRPKISIYIDGPFYADGNLREKTARLHGKVYESMLENSKQSNCEYIRYIKRDG